MSKLDELIRELCPNGVEYKKLGEIATVLRGASPRPIKKYITNDSDGVNWIKIGDVPVGSKYITQSEEKITKEGAEKSRYVRKGDFILSNSMSFGRPYILAIDGCIHDGWLSISNFKDALKKQIEISFGNVATTVFSEYRTRVENEFSKLSKEILLKLQAIEDKIGSDNPELYSQALTTCRRLFEETAKELFEKYFPGYEEKKYKTKSGKEIDVSGEHYKNKLSAVIEKLEDKSPSKSMVGSNVIYLLDWMDNLTDLQCKGVHHEVTRQDATRCIIQTYICLGDILSLQDE